MVDVLGAVRNLNQSETNKSYTKCHCLTVNHLTDFSMLFHITDLSVRTTIAIAIGSFC